MSLDGILYVEVLERSFTASAVLCFVEGLLDRMNPWPQKNSVLIMDNASIHKSDELRDLLSYSFSSIKAWLRANRDYVLGELMGEPQCDPYAMLWDAIFTVTSDKAYSWYRHSGYIL
ncbi:hypothetical protein K435DRAFT_736074 [Dendrothele bispora CBS 962.96]|uniref:Tc1-like transposase DDE domain-containing protein n=1 Tax=Dendrothele bispora (strain CBS 962.96) TaxID=1314807 RepID=A0A4S8KX74_DENBC|nr:hypothetical protein K435DRAFT_736074 [Dendrothele bispora CBS 962.96]